MADTGRRLAFATLAFIFVALAGCSSVTTRSGSAPPAPAETGNDAIRHALDMVGTPYRYGGSTPRGFDCSGLVQYSYAKAGIRLPRDVEGQWEQSRAVSRSQLRPGDLLFFNLNGQRHSHVGLYVGNDRFVHAPSTGKQVSTASLSSTYWRQRLSGTRRAVPD